MQETFTWKLIVFRKNPKIKFCIYPNSFGTQISSKNVFEKQLDECLSPYLFNDLTNLINDTLIIKEEASLKIKITI